METGTKHPKLTKFLELAAKVGWRQSDVARALKIGRAQISKIYNEKLPNGPSDRLLSLLEHEVNAILIERGRTEEANKNAVGIPPSAISENEKLSFLKQHDPAGFRVAANAIEPLYQRAVDEVILHEKKKPKRSSSSGVAGLATSSAEALKKIESAGSEGPAQSRGADAPPVHKPSLPAASSPPAKAPRTGRGGKGRT